MSTTAGTSWSLGTLIGLPLGIVTTAACLAAGVYFLRKRRAESGYLSYGPEFMVLAVGTFVLAALTAGLTAGGMYPWKAEYHKWTPVAGVVEAKADRFIPDGSSVSQRIVVVLDGQQYGCDDTRCALLEEGDFVELLCKPEFQYAAADGYGCRFVRAEAQR